MIDFTDLFERSPNPYMLLDRDLRFVAMNQAYLDVTGRTREDLVGRGLFEAFPGNPDDGDDSNVRELRSSLQRALDTGRRDTLGLIRYSIPVETEAGTVFEERFWSATHTPVPGAGGRAAYVLQHTVDVTELQRLKAELREARAGQGLAREQMESGVFDRARQVQAANRSLDDERRHLLRLFEEAPGFMAFLRGPRHMFELANASYMALVGRDDILGKPVSEALPDIEGQGYFELLDRVYQTGEPFVGSGLRVRLSAGADGGAREAFVDFVYQPVSDAAGQVIGILVQGHDITPQKEAQAELERYRNHLEELVEQRTRELEHSQAALRQAQKLEAIGKLTGGVAHDFNNVLQVIGANLQLLEMQQAHDARGLGYLHAGMDGVARGSRLAAQLLAFARRQPLQPVPLAVGERLQRLHELLRRTLGEQVALRVEMPAGLPSIQADPGQFDNALINLAINARDAMRGEGRLEIRGEELDVDAASAAELGGIATGRYVRIAVSDDGAGMSSEVVAQAFEPFFTTKPEGQGTGLGLSMVYGFVKQSGGHVTIGSVPGRGTTIGLYMPAAAAGVDGATPTTGSAGFADALHAGLATGETIEHGDETVLVVEDDEAVRASVVAMLRTLGYRVLQAPDARVGLAMLQGGARPDLLFTDVVMPGPVQSTELARRARTLVPGIAVLFTSGYPRDAILHDGRLDADVHLLGKPYRREELAARLRQVLAQARAAATRPVAGLRVLVVEDDDTGRVLAKELLRVLGHAPGAARDAEQALAQLAPGAWDVLLTDVRLPGMSGIELAAQARARDPGLRIVLATGLSAGDLREVGVADAALQKPYTPDQLQAALGVGTGA